MFSGDLGTGATIEKASYTPSAIIDAGFMPTFYMTNSLVFGIALSSQIINFVKVDKAGLAL